MVDVRKTKKYSCVNCGEPFEIHPPDDLHTTASRIARECEQNVKIEYKCKKCGNLNTIFWCRRGRHPDWYAQLSADDVNSKDAAKFFSAKAHLPETYS